MKEAPLSCQDPVALRELYLSTRRRTETLTSTLYPEDFVVQTMECMSPPRWHLGHTCWFFEMAFAQVWPAYQPFRSEFHWYFNSYYDRFGRRIERTLRGTRSRPTVDETLLYRRFVDEAVCLYLDGAPGVSTTAEGLELIRLGIEHEIQHQELLVYDIKNLLLDTFVVPPQLLGGRNRSPTTRESQRVSNRSESKPSPERGPDRFVSFDAGVFEMGSRAPDQSLFCFDNETPRHRVFNEHFLMATTPVTCAAFAAFIRDGGYEKSQLWLADGWNFIQREKIRHPLYWEEDEGEYFVRDFFGRHPVSECGDEPVCHVSYYEATAFARWAGARLPTESEWEQASCSGVQGALSGQEIAACIRGSNTLDAGYWRTVAVQELEYGRLPTGLSHFFGNVWEWTSSDYAPYPKYQPTFVEYNDKWMCNQRVLRGGSFATWGAHLRHTYRNFFYPHERWMLSGFRLAKSPA